MRTLLLTTIALFATLGAVTISPAHGAGIAQLDPKFADNGTFYHQGETLSPAFDAVEDPRGRLTVVGWAGSPKTSAYLLRMRPNGTLDQSFGNRTGVAYYPSKYFPDAESLTLDKQGRIFTLSRPGSDGPAPRGSCLTVTRRPPDGGIPIQGSFNQRTNANGTTMICELTEGQYGREYRGLHPRDITMSKSGKRILVSGTYYASSQRQGGFIVRIKPDGTIDKSLRGDRRTRTTVKGIVKLLPEKGFTGSFRDIRPLAGGKILVGGFLRGRFMAAQYEKDGSLDRSFGNKGVSTFDLDGDPKCRCSFGMAMVRDYNKRILIAGYVHPGDESDPQQIKVIRLRPNGRLDRKFGRNGVASLPKSIDTSARAIAVQKDGRIVVAGEINEKMEEPRGLFGLARFTPDGKLDNSFFEDGIYSDYVFGTFGEAWDVLVDSRDRIVASGGTHEGDFVIKRFLSR